GRAAEEWGGWPPPSPAASRSVPVTSPPWIASRASSAAGLAPGSRTARPSRTTSMGPSSRTCTPVTTPPFCGVGALSPAIVHILTRPTPGRPHGACAAPVRTLCMAVVPSRLGMRYWLSPQCPQEDDHDVGSRRQRAGFPGGNHRGTDPLPRVDRGLVGGAVLAPEGLHPGLHHRARLHGEDRARVRVAERQGDGLVGRLGR